MFIRWLHLSALLKKIQIRCGIYYMNPCENCSRPHGYYIKIGTPSIDREGREIGMKCRMGRYYCIHCAYDRGYLHAIISTL